MSIALTLAAAPASAKTTPTGGNAAARGDAREAGSFVELMENRQSDPAEKNAGGRRETDGAAPGWKTKGHSPWRPIDLLDADGADHPDDTGRPAGERTEEAGAELLPPAPQPVLQPPAEGAVPADVHTPPLNTPPPIAAGVFGRVAAEADELGTERRPSRTATPLEVRLQRTGDEKPGRQPAPAAQVGDAQPRIDGPQPARGSSDDFRDARSGRIPAAAERGDAKVAVVSSQVSLAPPPGLSPTGAAFVASLNSDGALPQYVAGTASADLAQQSGAARPVTTLKIQLHPAELGTVTVKLTGSGEQLSVEIQVENSDARHRLSTDSEAIVKALRGMGYDIDRITVQQAPSAAASPGGATNRENAFTPQDGRSGERQDQSGRQEPGQRDDQNPRGGAANGNDRGEARGSGVYI